MKYQTGAMQHEGEIARFLEILRAENIRSYLEIGSKFGGSLWKVSSVMPTGSRIVSVDLPWGNRETEPHLKDCIAALKGRGYDAHLILGDSTKPEVIEAVRALKPPFGACLIDANHTAPFVRADWNTYGPMARIVAFHDIGWIPRPEPSSKMPIDVPALWDEIKVKYRHEEIKMCPRDNGIGVLWRE